MPSNPLYIIFFNKNHTSVHAGVFVGVNADDFIIKQGVLVKVIGGLDSTSETVKVVVKSKA